MALDHSFGKGPATHVVLILVMDNDIIKRSLLEKTFWSEKQANLYAKKLLLFSCLVKKRFLLK